MVVFNPSKREIDIKVVYYGPALCGKTTNIQSVHRILNPKQRGELVSLATKDDRTLFFDFLPIELDSIKGFKTHFHVYTVPGQVLYNLTRRAVLTGVDGVIFVADSQTDKMAENIESLNDLKDNLKYYNKDLESFPFVIQYNKRDLDHILPVEEMESKLNSLQVPSFIGSAINDKGVMEALTMCCRMVLKQIKDKSKVKKVAEIEEKTKERDKEKIEEALSELPELSLIESHEHQEAVSDMQQPVQGEQEERVAETPLRLEEIDGVALETEATVEQMGEEEPIVAQDLLDGVIEQESIVDEARVEGQDEALGVDQEIKVEVFPPEVSVPGEKGIETLADSLPEETVRPGALDKEGKRTCPRCSLKFGLTVKQCPICKISLVQKGEAEEIGERKLEVPPDDTRAAEKAILAEEVSEAPGVIGKGDGEKGLEIIACGQPKKISPTAIKVPLIIKIDKTNQEFKVNLSISFDDFVLKQKE